MSRVIRKKIFSYFQIAAQTANSKDDRRCFLLGAIGIRSDQVMVKALNSPSDQPMAVAHAEAKLARKLTPNSIVYIARVRLIDGQFGLAKPCANCLKVLSSRGVSKIYYTIGPAEYGTIDMNNLPRIKGKSGSSGRQHNCYSY